MWEYDRIKIEFTKPKELVTELNKLGASGWEVFSYDEQKPEKFGGKYKSIVLIKKEK